MDWHVCLLSNCRSPLTRCAGVAEYLFRSRALLSAAISAALSDRIHRPDDTEFVVASREWSECVSFGNFDLYKRRFERTSGKLNGPLCRRSSNRLRHG
jgi:hypothetical protein